jgi:predicted enzyme related to lactoylglutathione lyase
VSGAKVTGIGGVFLRCDDPAALSAWYSKHLGIVATAAGEPGADGKWSWMQNAGETVYSFFPRGNAYFPTDKPVMVNFRVADLTALQKDLEAAGIAVERRAEWDHPEVGLFGRIHDPEGNPIELWQPPAEG